MESLLSRLVTQDLPVKMGNILIVKNTKARFGEADKYYLIHVQDSDGTELPMMFTEGELNDFLSVHSEVLESNLHRGHLSLFRIGKTSYRYVVKINLGRAGERLVSFSGKRYTAAKDRARKNPEDVKQKSWLTDLQD